jgi:RNA polymerase sigma factor (sigma-70 family)
MTAELLAELIKKHSPAMLLFARQWCHLPDDAVQIAFCKLVQQQTSPDDPAAWLFRVVRTSAIDLSKTERRRKNREVANVSPEQWFYQPTYSDSIERMESAEEVERAVHALKALPDDLREVIVLRLWTELTLEQIASVCECSVSSAHRRYEAGISKLRMELGESCPT